MVLSPRFTLLQKGLLVVIIRPQAVDVMASTVRPRSSPGRHNRRGRRPGVLELDEHQVLGVVVDVVEELSPVVAAAVGADVDVLHQDVVLVVAFLACVVHRVLLKVEVLDRVVVVVVVAAVDGLIELGRNGTWF
ncbi:hypothetical protein GEV33_000207 [Tenebrio molitor]|uniref:Uncharacterized protein n=1 Tax=Tenebrio molitor TaxID=7067 RepID=A0A8J6HXE0_TENMO|nr:hypothetical protein GEV33_000207 [Tenebrio molitor]